MASSVELMLTQLQLETFAELADPAFIHRKHFSRSTYKVGCHGPLCLKSERDKRVRRYAALKPTRIPRERSFLEKARDEYLETVIEAYSLRSEAQAETERQAELDLELAS